MFFEKKWETITLGEDLKTIRSLMGRPDKVQDTEQYSDDGHRLKCKYLYYFRKEGWITPRMIIYALAFENEKLVFKQKETR